MKSSIRNRNLRRRLDPAHVIERNLRKVGLNLTKGFVSSSTLAVRSGKIPRARDNDGRKLDHHTLEVLRIRAVEQVEAGAHPVDIALALGLNHKTVYG